MRDRNQNYIQFNKQLGKVVEKKTTLSRLLRTTVSDNPTFPSDQLQLVYPRKFSELQGLALVFHYLPESLYWEIKLGLEDMNLNHLNRKQILEIRIMFSSEENMVKYLYLTKRYTSNEIFGNIVKNGVNTLKNLKIIKRSTKVVKPVRKRGYTDKGSLRPKEKWLPSHDYTLTDLQREIEEKRTRLDKSVNHITNYLENWTNGE